MMTRDEMIKRAAKVRTEKVTIEEWDNAEVAVRELLGSEAKEMASAREKGVNELAWVVCHTVCREDGTRMFEDRDMAIVEGFGLRVLKKLANMAVQLSGLVETEKNV